MSSLPRLEYHLINAFTTDSPHSGNQAAVVLFASSLDSRANDDKFLLTTAQDFGYSETAYLVPIDEQAGRWGLRWFTIYNVRYLLASELISRQAWPKLTVQEVPICGHATLAAGKVVLSKYPELPEVKFETRSWGELTARRRIGGIEDPDSPEVTISLSTLPKAALDKLVENGPRNLQELAEPIATVLGIQQEQVFGVGEFKYNKKSLIVEVGPDVDLANLRVDIKALVRFSGITPQL